jgi:hypothetical protein
MVMVSVVASCVVNWEEFGTNDLGRREEKRESPSLDNQFPARGSIQVSAELKSRAGVCTLLFLQRAQTLL